LKLDSYVYIMIRKGKRELSPLLTEETLRPPLAPSSRANRLIPPEAHRKATGREAAPPG
jgi:hypothetical protein